jgi:regulator of protease activity HflC (stomatin/prohibitin superfamily)
MSDPVIFAILTIILVGVVLVKALVLVPEGVSYVTERLGRVDAVLRPGLHFIVPIVSRVAAVIPTTIQRTAIPAADCRTRDDVPASCEGTISFRVTDPARVHTSVPGHQAAMVVMTSGVWTKAVQRSDAANAQNAVLDAENEIRSNAAGWGIEVVEILPRVTVRRWG